MLRGGEYLVVVKYLQTLVDYKFVVATHSSKEKPGDIGCGRVGNARKREWRRRGDGDSKSRV